VNGPAPCGSDIPSILELQLRKSVELTRRPSEGAIEKPDQGEQDDTLQRLKKLLAETREMVTRAEALVASMRSPRDYYAQADGG
jgi:hypothetical protein